MIYCEIHVHLFVIYRHITVSLIPTLYSEGQTSNRLPAVILIGIFVAFIVLCTPESRKFLI
jgi:hypothetical protein